MELLDGKKCSLSYNKSYKQEVINLIAEGKRAPHLVAILIGDNVASQTYVRNKVKTCQKIGYTSTLLHYEKDYTEDELLATIEQLNGDPSIDGILVQLPLPRHITESKIIDSINPSKDVDGFHPINIGKMVLGEEGFVSATPLGITQLLQYYDIDTTGMHCVVIGRSNIVGTPVSILLSRNTMPGNASVTLCHSRTKNLAEICRDADIIIVAVGKKDTLTADMVKEGVIVIDVGMNKKEDASKKAGYRLVGDVDFEGVAPKCSYITPVPGGVGPMTISALMSNTLKAYKMKVEDE